MGDLATFCFNGQIDAHSVAGRAAAVINWCTFVAPQYSVERAIVMTMQQTPLVGNWYMNMTGQLLKVWAVSYADRKPATVVIEYLNGKRKIVGIQDWYHLDLELHLYQTIRRRNREEINP